MCWVPLAWRYRHLWAATLVLAIEPKSSVREMSILNCWAKSLAPEESSFLDQFTACRIIKVGCFQEENGRACGQRNLVNFVYWIFVQLQTSGSLKKGQGSFLLVLCINPVFPILIWSWKHHLRIAFLKSILWRIFGKNYSSWDGRTWAPLKIIKVLWAMNYISGRKWFLKANSKD